MAALLRAHAADYADQRRAHEVYNYEHAQAIVFVHVGRRLGSGRVAAARHGDGAAGAIGPAAAYPPRRGGLIRVPVEAGSGAEARAAAGVALAVLEAHRVVALARRVAFVICVLGSCQ